MFHSIPIHQGTLRRESLQRLDLSHFWINKQTVLLKFSPGLEGHQGNQPQGFSLTDTLFGLWDPWQATSLFVFFPQHFSQRAASLFTFLRLCDKQTQCHQTGKPQQWFLLSFFTANNITAWAVTDLGQCLRIGKCLYVLQTIDFTTDWVLLHNNCLFTKENNSPMSGRRLDQPFWTTKDLVPLFRDLQHTEPRKVSFRAWFFFPQRIVLSTQLDRLCDSEYS